MIDTAAAASRACRALLGQTPIETAFPGGRSRDSLRLHLESGSVIATRRKQSARARLEADVLHALGDLGAPVPRVLGFDGTWLLQEDLGERRLSQALDDADETDYTRLLGAALEALARIHEAGAAAGIVEGVSTIGATDAWIGKLAELPARLGEQCGPVPPALPVPAITDRLRVARAGLIKWDSRPANAIVRDSGAVAWFDWEHCGRRNRLDDLVWLLADEYVPDFPGAETRLLEHHLPAFAGDADLDAADEYLRLFGTLHMCLRLSLIFAKKADGPWWTWESCLADDTVGVTRQAALALCRRAARWAQRAMLTQDLVPWLEALARPLADDEV